MPSLVDGPFRNGKTRHGDKRQTLHQPVPDCSLVKVGLSESLRLGPLRTRRPVAFDASSAHAPIMSSQKNGGRKISSGPFMGTAALLPPPKLGVVSRRLLLRRKFQQDRFPTRQRNRRLLIAGKELADGCTRSEFFVGPCVAEIPPLNAPLYS